MNLYNGKNGKNLRKYANCLLEAGGILKYIAFYFPTLRFPSLRVLRYYAVIPHSKQNI